MSMADPATTINGNTELMTFIFRKLHQKLDIELTALRDKYNRLARAHNELAVRVARIEGIPA